MFSKIFGAPKSDTLTIRYNKRVCAQVAGNRILKNRDFYFHLRSRDTLIIEECKNNLRSSGGKLNLNDPWFVFFSALQRHLDIVEDCKNTLQKHIDIKYF